MQTFIIRLKDDEHSCKIAKDCKNQAEKFSINAEYFDAINGLDAAKHYKLTEVPKPKKAIKKGRLGVLGCFFSHYYLWRECASSSQPFCILEHDGYFIRHLPKAFFESFQDVLKLDACDPYSSNYDRIVYEHLDKPIRIEKYTNPNPKAISKIGTGNYFKGAYSYILKPSGAKKLVNFIHENKNGKGHRPADQQIGDAVLDTKVTIPTVARLHPFYSIGSNINTKSLTKNIGKNNV